MYYYTYAYLREDKTPYYVGKGKGRRVYLKHQKGISVPKDKSRIIFLKQNLTEEEAFKHEIYMIAVFGRKDLGMGILHNRTNGGEGTGGRNISKEEREKSSQRMIDSNPMKNKDIRKKVSDKLKGRKISKKSIDKRNKTRKENGVSISEKHREILSNIMKKKIGEKNHRFGKTHNQETKKLISDSKIGNTNVRGKKWWNDGQINKMMVECPGDGWIPGRCPKK
jgi:hypothetical protein